MASRSRSNRRIVHSPLWKSNGPTTELMVVPDLTTKGTKKHEGSRPLCNFVSFVVYEIRCRINRKNRIDRSLADTVFLSPLCFHLLSLTLTFPGRKSEVACGRVDSDAWEN